MIDVSPNDDRQYKYVKLPNDMEVLLVHDPSSEKSAACCNVHIGSMADNVDAQGLAHFLEHMLFLGTKEYPVENSYSSYLSNHGGSSNAYTDQENTVYYFDVQSEYFEGAIDMFASFFTCPLFTDTATLRELNAVDSENTKNLQSDSWRQYQLLKSLAKADHPFSKFSTGNLETLKTIPESKGINIRDLVIDFYSQHYSSNIMKLVLYGRDSLDVMENYAKIKFSNIPNKNLSRFSVPSDPYGPNELSKVIEVVPVKDLKEVDIYFPLPPVGPLYHTKPSRYLSHLVGHESEGSILYALKAKGWANSLGAMTYAEMTDFASFRVHIELTDEGVKHAEDVVACVFAYIGMMSRECVKPANRWIHTELRDMMEMHFRFEEKSEPARYATHLANNMQLYPPKHFITGDKLIFCDDDSVITSVTPLLNQLTVMNSLVFIKHRGFKGNTTFTEKCYQTEYNLKSFTAAQISEWTKSYNGSNGSYENMLHLPVPNVFVPTDFNLRCSDTSTATVDTDRVARIKSIEPQSLISGPTMLECVKIDNSDQKANNTDSRDNVITSTILPRLPGTALVVWHKQDGYWRVPKLSVMISLESALSSISPLNIALTELLSLCLKEKLSAYSYYADCAGLGFDVRLAKGGIDMTFEGFHHKLPILVEKTVSELKSLASFPMTDKCGCPQDVFIRMKEKLLRNFHNHVFWQPYYHCVMGTLTCLEEPRWTPTERYHALTYVTYEEFCVFASQFIRQLKVESFVHGNATADEAKSLSQSVVNLLSAQALPTSQTPNKRVVRLDTGTTYIYRLNGSFYNPDEVNSACENFYFVGEAASSTDTESTLLVGRGGGRFESESISGSTVSLEMSPEPDILCIWNTLFGCSDKKNIHNSSSDLTTAAVVATSSNNHDKTMSMTMNDKLTLEALTELVVHLMNEPAFDQLRTKEQLGYIVYTSMKRINTMYGIHIIVQSSHKDPDFLNNRIELFLQSYRRTILADMTSEDLQQNIDAVVENLVEKPKNLDDEARRHIEEIRSGAYLFNRRYLLAQILKSEKHSIKLSDLLQFYDHFIINYSQRKKFSSRFTGSTSADTNNKGEGNTDANVKVTAEVSTEQEEKDFKESSTTIEISNHAMFKKVMHLFPVSTTTL